MSTWKSLFHFSDRGIFGDLPSQVLNRTRSPEQTRRRCHHSTPGSNQNFYSFSSIAFCSTKEFFMLVFAQVPYLPEYLEVIIQCQTVFQKNVKSMHTSLSQVKGKTDYSILQQMTVYVFNSHRPSAGPTDSVILWPQHKELQAIQSSSRLMMVIQSCTTFYNSHVADTVSSHLQFLLQQQGAIVSIPLYMVYSKQ